MKIVNKRGKDFLDICRINDLSIVNGRTIGDIFGSYTCHQKKGSSVVDYLLTPCHNLHSIVDFSVGEHQPILSDHCPIGAGIQLKSVLKVDSQKAKLHTLHLFGMKTVHIHSQNNLNQKNPGKECRHS